jgi:beta-phosphoglucomutase
LAKFKAVIFDLDGVLVHTDRFHYFAWKATADELGAYFDETINMRLRGVSRMESLEIILERYAGPTLSNAEKLALAEKKNSLYRSYLETMTPKDVEPKVPDVLKKLKAAKLLLAVGSSSKNARFIIEKIGLLSYFDAVSDGNNIKNSKPDPEVFLKAAEFLEVSPKNSLVVEDAVSGIEAAIRGGFFAAATGDAKNHRRAHFLFDDFDELLSYIIC